VTKSSVHLLTQYGYDYQFTCSICISTDRIQQELYPVQWQRITTAVRELESGLDQHRPSCLMRRWIAICVTSAALRNRHLSPIGRFLIVQGISLTCYAHECCSCLVVSWMVGLFLSYPKSDNHGNALLMLSSSLAKQKLTPTAAHRSNSTVTG
jgi:hypothetical protein